MVAVFWTFCQDAALDPLDWIRFVTPPLVLPENQKRYGMPHAEVGGTLALLGLWSQARRGPEIAPSSSQSHRSDPADRSRGGDGKEMTKLQPWYAP